MFGLGKKDREKTDTLETDITIVPTDGTVGTDDTVGTVKEEEEVVNINQSSVVVVDDTSATINTLGSSIEDLEQRGFMVPDPKTKKKEVPQDAPLTWKEERSLKKARYNEIFPRFKTAYVLRNKRTGQIAEIRAASSYHACKIIGWKSTKVQVLEVKDMLINIVADLKRKELKDE